MEKVKDYTFTVEVLTPEGLTEFKNETDMAKGYRKGWYKTEAAAREGLKKQLAISELCGESVLAWSIYGRSHSIGIIEQYGEENRARNSSRRV